jgi:alkylhydroperoxidase family enzyme
VPRVKLVSDDKASEEMKRRYSDAEIAELTLKYGLFKMWNRFSRGLQIELEPAEQRQLTACLARPR